MIKMAAYDRFPMIRIFSVNVLMTFWPTDKLQILYNSLLFDLFKNTVLFLIGNKAFSKKSFLPMTWSQCYKTFFASSWWLKQGKLECFLFCKFEPVRRIDRCSTQVNSGLTF
jgi:hypothetical protein